MGRGGGSSGGHSGGHGRSHYGGSHSRGGGSSSRSFSSSSRSRSYHHHSTSRSYYRGGIGYSRTYDASNDPLFVYKFLLFGWNVAVAFIALTVALIVFGSVTPSTIARKPLQSQQCIESNEWYEDNDGTWIYNSGKLIEGLRQFYKVTGIQPYLVIDTGDINGEDYPSAEQYEKYLMDIYAEKFSDGGHLVVGFNEPVPNSYGMYYVIGDEAKAVFDDEAGEILFDYIDNNYTSDMSDEEMFATSFKQAAKRMMKKSITLTQALTVVVIIIVLGDILLFTLLGMAVYKKKKAESDREVARVLGTEMDNLVDESLKDKYLQ